MSQLKTMAGWHEAAVDLGRYLEIGDTVSEDMAIYKKAGVWVWAGFCYRGEFTEPAA
jgi:hypothetical protein